MALNISLGMPVCQTLRVAHEITARTPNQLQPLKIHKIYL
jgi:hypothetical protein